MSCTVRIKGIYVKLLCKSISSAKRNIRLHNWICSASQQIAYKGIPKYLPPRKPRFSISRFSMFLKQTGIRHLEDCLLLLCSRLGRKLRLGPGASTLGALRVAGKLDLLRVFQVHDLLETLAKVHQNISTLLQAAALATGHIPIASTRHALTHSLRP